MAKSVRRDMRRAMGEGALGTIKEQDTAIGMIANGLANVQREIATLAIGHATNRKDSAEDLERINSNLNVAFANIGEGRREFYNFKERGLLARLRWLFTGK